MKITYKDKEIELKYSFRSLMIYENIMNKSFKPESLTDVITFFYCVVISNMRDETIQFDEFVDYLDEEPQRLTDFSQWLLEQSVANAKKAMTVPDEKPKPRRRAPEKDSEKN